MRLALIIAAFSVAGCATKQIDYTGGKSNNCELHHVAMVETLVPVYYGLFPVDQRSLAMYQASTNSFPHAQDSVNPSCVVASPKQGSFTFARSASASGKRGSQCMPRFIESPSLKGSSQ